MSVDSDNLNRNVGAAIGMDGSKKIAYNLIRSLLLVSVPLFLFGVHSWKTCVVLVFVPSI